MFGCLTAFNKPRFKFSLCSWDYKSSYIGLSRSLNHIWNIVLMSRCIKNCESFCFCLEKGSSNFNGFPFLSFFWVGINKISFVPGFTLGFCCFLLDSSKFILINHIGIQQNTATSGRLSTSNMPDEYNIQWFSWKIRLSKFTFVNYYAINILIIIIIRTNWFNFW